MPYKDRERRLEYAREWNRTHYKNNTSAEKVRIYTRRREISQWFATYKESLCCQNCGESTSVCLDFHHKDSSEKDVNLARVKNWGWSITRLKSEIKKCIVLCSNCHRKVHAKLISVK